MSSTVVPLLRDYHIHTARCNHADSLEEQYVLRALHLGLKEIGFSDHLPLGPDYDHGHTMTREELALYVKEIERLRKKYPSISILLGGEVGLFPDFAQQLQQLRSSNPFDYIIGSVHYFGSLFVFLKTPLDDLKFDQGQEVNTYFNLYEEGIASGLVDVVGHMDGIKWLFSLTDPLIQQRLERLLSRIASADIILEVNSSGLRKKPNRLYPDDAIIRRAGELGIAFCAGSDAHRPEEVGLDFDSIQKSLERAGIYGTAVSDSGLTIFRAGS